MKITKVTEDAVATLLDDLLKRSPNNYTGYADKVQAIIDDVRERGDEALFEMTKRFDGADLNADNIRVTQAEIDEAYTLVDASLIEVIRKAMTNIRVYHEKQRQYGWFDTTPDGTILGQKGDTTSEYRCLCSGRQGCLSVFCSDECDSCQGSRC